ncbi:MAG: hypothetical protein U9Q18_06530 [Caldisericota bacterium]|nr:hypothetical protein [Caldisericota bacterium]
MSLPDNSQKRTLAIKTVFWTVVGVFATTAIMIVVGNKIQLHRGVFVSFLFGGGTALLVLGIVLIILTLKSGIGGKLKKFLILTGASVAGFFVAILLHNFIYGLFVHFYGKDFWNRIGPGGDEPVFFILAVVVCPIGFLIGTIGSAVLFTKK